MVADKSITWGHPSYVWRFGQERRLELIRRYAPLEGHAILDVGCGIGVYIQQFRRFSPRVYGIDIDAECLAEARVRARFLVRGCGECLPFADNSFDVVILHEVLEHMTDDAAAAREAVRVVRPGGRVVVYAPNRLYPFETHGFYWRGRYHFGLAPLVNYLPDRWRRRWAPHVRAYLSRDLKRLFADLPVRPIVHRFVYPGFDRIEQRRWRLAAVLRRVCYFAEATPLARFGLSHFLVMEKLPSIANPVSGSGRG